MLATLGRFGDKLARKEPSPRLTWARLVIPCRRTISSGLFGKKQQSQGVLDASRLVPTSTAHCVVPKGQAKDMYCAVTMQRDNSIDSCFGLLGGVTLASSPLPIASIDWIQSLKLEDNPGHSRTQKGLRIQHHFKTLHELFYDTEIVVKLTEQYDGHALALFEDAEH